MQKISQDEARGKAPTSHRPDFICTNCGETYHSAAPLGELVDPYCNECRGELAEYFRPNTPGTSEIYDDRTGDDLV